MNIREFQLWSFEVMSELASSVGIPEENRFYDGVTTYNPPETGIHFRGWIRNYTSRDYSFAPPDQPRRIENKGSLFFRIMFPVSTMALLNSSWELGILAQTRFRRRDHPCGIVCREANLDPVGAVSGEVYYQILLSVRYEFDEFQ